MKRWPSKLENLFEILLLGMFLVALAFFTILFSGDPHLAEFFDNRFSKQYIVSWITRHLTGDGFFLIAGMVFLACGSLAAFHLVAKGYRDRWQSLLFILSIVFVLLVGLAWQNSGRIYHVAIQPFSILLGISIANLLRLFFFLMPNGRFSQWNMPLTLIALTIFPTISAFSLSLGKSDVYADGVKRVSGFWSDPNIYGALLSMSLLVWLGLGAALAYRIGSGASSQFRKVLAYASLFVAVVIVSKITFALIATSSRSAIVGSFLGVVVLCLLSQRHPLLNGRRSKPILIGIVTLFVLIAAGCWYVQPGQVEAISSRFAKPVQVGDASVGNRFHALHGTIRMFLDGRVQGYSWSSRIDIYAQEYKSPTVADAGAFSLNDFLQVALASGLPGLLCLLGIIGIGLLAPLPKSLAPEIAVLHFGCRAALLSGLVCAWFNRVLASPDTAVLFWVLLFIGMSLHFAQVSKHCKYDVAHLVPK